MASHDWVEKDYYKILGVSQDASKEDIKKAYRKLAQEYHPDANAGPEAEARFKEISEAHSVLSKDEKRREYDEIRRLAASGGQRFYGTGPGGGNVRVDIGDLFGEGQGGMIFEDLFGFAPRQRRGGDVETQVTLSFDDAVRGSMVTLGDGTRVRIPAGVSDGSRIKVAGKGRPGSSGGPPGDLYVQVSVEPHPVFTLGKKGSLRVSIPVTYPEAALGAKVVVPTLGDPVTVKVPAGTKHGKTLRLRGKGTPRPGGGYGDLLVTIEVEVPQKLSRKEKEALEAFAAVHKSDPREHLRPYLKSTSKAS